MCKVLIPRAWAGYHLMLIKTVTYNVLMTHMTMEVDQCLNHNEKKNKNKYSRLKTVYDNITINLHCCYSTLYLSFKTSNSLRLDFIYILTKKKPPHSHIEIKAKIQNIGKNI